MIQLQGLSSQHKAEGRHIAYECVLLIPWCVFVCFLRRPVQMCEQACILAANGNQRPADRRAYRPRVAVHTPVSQEQIHSAGPSRTTGTADNAQSKHQQGQLISFTSISQVKHIPADLTHTFVVSKRLFDPRARGEPSTCLRNKCSFRSCWKES